MDTNYQKMGRFVILKCSSLLGLLQVREPKRVEVSGEFMTGLERAFVEHRQDI